MNLRGFVLWTNVSQLVLSVVIVMLLYAINFPGVYLSQANMVMAASFCGEGFLQQELGDESD